MEWKIVFTSTIIKDYYGERLHVMYHLMTLTLVKPHTFGTLYFGTSKMSQPIMYMLDPIARECRGERSCLSYGLPYIGLVYI